MLKRILSNPYLIIPIIIIGLGLRVINLEADIPYFVHHNYVADEGGWSHNARNYYVNGSWFDESHNSPYFSAPGYSHFLYGMFRLTGLSMYSGRLLSSIAGTLTIIVLWMFCANKGTVMTANVAAIILTLSGIHIIYSRLIMTEVLLMFMLMLFFYFWSKKQNFIYAALSGITLSVLLTIKLSAIHFIPSLLILIYLEILRKEIRLNSFIVFATSSLISIIILLSVYYLPYLSDCIEWYNNAYLKMSDIYDHSIIYISEIALFNLVLSELGSNRIVNKVFIFMPVISMLAFYYIFNLITKMQTSFFGILKSINYVEVVGISIFLGNIFIVAVSNYKPERRYIAVLLGMSMLAAVAIKEIYSHNIIKLNVNYSSFIANTLVIILINIPVYVFIVYILYMIFGTWKVFNIGKHSGVSYYGQVILLSPLYVALIASITAQLKSNKFEYKVILMSMCLLLAHIVTGWLYYGCQYFSVYMTPESITTLTVIIWFMLILAAISVVKILNYKRIIKYIAVSYMLVELTIIGFIFVDPTYTYKEMGECSAEIIKEGPLVTLVSAPYIGNKDLKIYYGYPDDRSVLNKYKKYYVITTFKNATDVSDGKDIKHLYKKDRLPDAAVLKNTYNAIPFGKPRQNQLIAGLWIVENN